MSQHEVSPTPSGGLPVSPALASELQAEFPPLHRKAVDRRVVVLACVAAGIGVLATLASQALLALIALITNLAFFGRLSLEHASPADNHLGPLLFFVPVIGGVIVGIMARFGSKAIRGHGIPEAMEQVLTNQSRIPARMTLLKPISAAVAIGTGGPFGAEGPIIATGGALGSLVGQILSTTGSERKALLAAGAAAGMTATFGTPVAALFLAVELLLFEYRPQSLLPVAIASIIAAAGRMLIEGAAPVFAMPPTAMPGVWALVAYAFMGAFFGLAAVGATRAIYAVEDAFERLPIHWMWWPALGGIAVGVCGWFVPRSLGIGYNNLTDLLAGSLTLRAAAVLCAAKFVSWAISLGSGTSGGTLAPLMTVGGCLGAVLAMSFGAMFPDAAVDIRLAALVGMAALFAGAARAPLASAMFAFEATREAGTVLPLFIGCIVSYFVSCLVMRNSLMTEKIARRGVATPTEYVPDTLDQVLVRDVATKELVVLHGDDTVEKVRRWLVSGSTDSRHQGFPVVDDRGTVLGVVTRKDLALYETGSHALRCVLQRLPIIVYDDCSVREATEHMLRHDVGRLPVVRRGQAQKLIGIITRSDILSAYMRRLHEHERDGQRPPERPTPKPRAKATV